jgi:hypothetical protein
MILDAAIRSEVISHRQDVIMASQPNVPASGSFRGGALSDAVRATFHRI